MAHHGVALLFLYVKWQQPSIAGTLKSYETFEFDINKKLNIIIVEKTYIKHCDLGYFYFIIEKFIIIKTTLHIERINL